MARKMFSGRWALIPNSLNISCSITVTSILEDPIVDVSDAPILLNPVEYDKEPINGSNEKNKKTTTLNTKGCPKANISLDGNISLSAAYDIIPTTIKPTRIKPEVSIDAPATSKDEEIVVSLVRKMTPPAKPMAESIASTSPKLIILTDIGGDFAIAGETPVILLCVSSETAKLVSLTTAIQKPSSAIPIPIKWNPFSLSFRNSLAKSTIITISSGPAMRTSFDAPIRLIESYHVNIPNDSDRDARIRFFHNLAKRKAIFLVLLNT